MSLDQAQSWNGRTFYLGAARTQGATTIALRDGQGAQLQAAVTAAGGQTISTSHPLRFTVVARTAINPQTRQILDYSRRAAYTATGISGDSLTGVALASGTDQAWEANDLVASERDASWENAVAAATAAASGGLIAANNLSDLANAATARNNLGLGTAATYTATYFATASSLSGYAALSGAAFTGDVSVPNSGAYKSKLADGTAVSLATIDNGNNTFYGTNYGDTYINILNYFRVTTSRGWCLLADKVNDNVSLVGGYEPCSGTRIVYLANAIQVPVSNPSGGGILYAEGGALKWRGSSGTVTTIAPA